MKYEFLAFDLDGTLTDPKLGITKGVQYALGQLGIEAPDLDALVPFIGPPLLETFQERYGLTETGARQAVGYYREYYEAGGLYENLEFPSITTALTTLAGTGRQLAVATSKPTVYAKKILRHFGMEHFFAFIIGSELDGSRTAKGDVIRFLLETATPSDLSRVVMIGDRKHDIDGAHQNGIDSIGVTYGYGSREELVAAGATHIVSSVGELLALSLSL